DQPSPAAIKTLCAQLNSGGNVAMFHIVGVTPEAQTIEQAFGGRAPEAEVTITQDDLDAMRADLTAPYGPIDFALFGCPHLSIDQITTIAEMVDGKRLAVPLFAMTSALTYDLALNMGYLDTIRQAGGEIFSNTCMDQPVWRFLEGKTGVTESPKCAYYTKRRSMDFVITELESAVAGALIGAVQR
ncbi:aconitase X, partial [Brooklawnia sp.]|uniref:aconitase X n=1 Tax=Brooklawnia sp. TaxID=2699740 RepID=UPI00311FAB4C